jgi:hypothetical protein
MRFGFWVISLPEKTEQSRKEHIKAEQNRIEQSFPFHSSVLLETCGELVEDILQIAPRMMMLLFPTVGITDLDLDLDCTVVKQAVKQVVKHLV